MDSLVTRESTPKSTEGGAAGTHPYRCCSRCHSQTDPSETQRERSGRAGWSLPWSTGNCKLGGKEKQLL